MQKGELSDLSKKKANGFSPYNGKYSTENYYLWKVDDSFSTPNTIAGLYVYQLGFLLLLEFERVTYSFQL